MTNVANLRPRDPNWECETMREARLASGLSYPAIPRGECNSNSGRAFLSRQHIVEPDRTVRLKPVASVDPAIRNPWLTIGSVAVVVVAMATA